MGKASTLFLAVSIMIIMVGMGLGLAVQDFNRVADNPTGSYWAVQLNYFVTPCWFWTLSYFDLAILKRRVNLQLGDDTIN